ncbi:hypothetical protein PYW08_016509 [Mythimna loreyi]|uniref:Uncharacterized protein n=1 Tax=Mythimna loreyi TaxID=667449 RepID=A0ACC2QXU9_9NEOP|nr:hypothetical protein PYW08_016509 [Mythimna loreyi]
MLRMFIRTINAKSMVRTMADKPPSPPPSVTKSKKPPISIFGLEGRYVSALYSAASQMNELEKVEKSLINLQKELKKPKIVDFCATSLISRAAKAKLLIAISNEAGMPKSMTNFLGLVAENGRLKLLDRMIKMYLAVMVAHRNEALCEVITADPLDDATRTKLVNILKRFVPAGKKIQLQELVKPDAIGGVVIGFEDKHIDMTIAKRITLYRGRIKYYIKYQ